MEFKFEDFLADISQEYRNGVTQIHEELTTDKYKMKIEKKASGLLVSYSHPKTKRSLLNWVFRKSGLHIRIYAEGHANYADFISTLPNDMEASIAKSSQCKQFFNPPQCSPKCRGYDISIRGNKYQKCRYDCFLMQITQENLPIITELIRLEKETRVV